MFEDVNMLRWFFACVTLAILLGGFAILAKKLNPAQIRNVRKGRLKVADSLWLDAKHRMFIIKQDDTTEHTVIIGPAGNTLHVGSAPAITTQDETDDA